MRLIMLIFIAIIVVLSLSFGTPWNGVEWLGFE